LRPQLLLPKSVRRVSGWELPEPRKILMFQSVL